MFVFLLFSQYCTCLFLILFHFCDSGTCSLSFPQLYETKIHGYCLTESIFLSSILLFRLSPFVIFPVFHFFLLLNVVLSFYGKKMFVCSLFLFFFLFFSFLFFSFLFFSFFVFFLSFISDLCVMLVCKFFKSFFSSVFSTL